MCSDLTFGPPLRSNEDSQVKSAYNSLIIAPRGLGCQTNLSFIKCHLS